MRGSDQGGAAPSPGAGVAGNAGFPPNLQLIGSKGLGGAERWFMRYAAALAERGARAQIGLRRGSALDSHDFGPLPVHRLPFFTVWDGFSRRAVDRLIRRLGPAIIQTFMGRATRLTRLPPGGDTVHLARLGGYYALGPYRHAHAWLGNTKGLCDWMIAQGLPAARVHHIYNFTDPAHPLGPLQVDGLRADLGIPPEAWVLVTLGRLVAVKGHACLIEALARLPATLAGRPLRLVMVGDGPLGDRLRRQAVALDQDGRICWAGWQLDPTPYLALADLVVFPSLEAETLGNVLLEAWAWGRPLVSTRFRGARELARHGVDAWCVPCGDSRAIAHGIATVLGDRGLRAALASGGQERVQREFCRDVIMDQYRDLYRSLARV